MGVGVGEVGDALASPLSEGTSDRELQYLPVRHGVREDVPLAEAGVVFGAGPTLVQPRYDAGVAEPVSEATSR